MLRRWTLALVISCGIYSLGQENGKLQIHFMDAGQADAAVLISPKGEVVLFDNGVLGDCDKPISYLKQLGVTKIDYNIVSHYHADHLGCTGAILKEYPLQKIAYDRGGSKAAAPKAYLKAVGTHRKSVRAASKIILDADTNAPVEIVFVAVNGNGIKTSNENDRSVVALVNFGEFNAEIGGDLSGVNTGSYDDIETSVAPKIGQVEVYKVHHHGSQYSSNAQWLTAIHPQVAIVSVGDGNRHHHPTTQCLNRLHAMGTRVYWTATGNGAKPAKDDVVGRNIVVQVASGATTYSVTYKGSFVDTYSVWGAGSTSRIGLPAYAWSKLSQVYHYASCKYVDNVAPGNLERGDDPPLDKTLHANCPK